MAEAIIAAFIEVALSQAISILDDQLSLSWDFKAELNKLRSSLQLTRAFLQDAESRRLDDEPVKVWLQQLRDIAYVADDVLDELAYEHLRRAAENSQVSKKVSNFFTPSKNPMAFTLKMGKIVKDVNKSMDEIVDRAFKFGLQQRVQNMAPAFTGTGGTHSFNSSRVVGREADVQKIVGLLISSNTDRRGFSIVSIVGMGGLGKTTLAKSVCNDEKVVNFFGTIMWVCVAENFNVRRILLEMLESLTRKSCEIKNDDVVLKEIQKELNGKSFLLVLDDVWDEDVKNWEDLKGCLLGINESKQSCILVTSRGENVSLVRETPAEYRHHLDAMRDEECWSIIRERAFGSSFVSSDLEAIGRDIARKCAGVPLVAAVIGGTVCNRWDRDEWVTLRDSSLWGSLEKNEGVVCVLKLSYDRLSPPSLKQCFAYCSIFPKDFRIQKNQLIQHWMAEGFLRQFDGNSHLSEEDIGNEYFNILVSNSLFQDAEKDQYGCITTCKMHDLVLELAQSISHIYQENVFNGVRLWRSLFLKSGSIHTVRDFESLRVLSFCDADIVSLSESIGRLKHLRYFDISRTSINRLPKSITQLYHLQTLRLLGWSGPKPEGMENLVNLRHLYIDDERHVPDKIGCLTCLRTLPIFKVGTTRRSGIGELGGLVELAGELDIFDLQNVRNKGEAQKAKLREKKKLHKLGYHWQGEREAFCNDDDEEVLEGLEPHSNLRSLSIVYYKGGHYPSWLAMKTNVSGPSACFQPINLVKLELYACENLKELPTLGHYPNLKILEVDGLNNVWCIGKEFYTTDDDSTYRMNTPIALFPALEKLSLRNMTEVKEWLEVELTVPVFPSLKELDIQGCRELSSVPRMSRLSCLEELTIMGNNALRWIGDEPNPFPSSLRKLTIEECYNLRSIPDVEGGVSFLQHLKVNSCDKLCKIGEGLLASTCIRLVDISDCSNLISFPLRGGHQSLSKLMLVRCKELRGIEGALSACTRLESLDVVNCHNLIPVPIPSLDDFSSLVRLRLDGCTGLRSLPSGLRTCTCLKFFIIQNCTDLESIPEDVGQLHSLVELSISSCRNLKSIPEDSLRCLTCLKRLTLGPFSEELDEFPGLGSIHHLHSSLRSLTLTGWGKLCSLPHQLQHLTALEYLTISQFDGVKSLPEWFGSLSSLKYLVIRFCRNLEILPSKGTMYHLPNIVNITITECPRLKGCRTYIAKRFQISAMQIIQYEL
ncbi:hypothetical protein V6N13_080109 [Hibiscus sabdariffa]